MARFQRNLLLHLLSVMACTSDRLVMEGGNEILVIGLSGGIASGKSTVSKSLAGLGATVINADLLGHDVYAKGTPGFELMKTAFTSLALIYAKKPLVNPVTGEIDRGVVGSLVFNKSHPEWLHMLNSICWPIIKEKIGKAIANRKQTGAKFVVVEAAVLLEAHWEDLFDEVWAVEVNEGIAFERLIARSKQQGRPLSESQALDRINMQKRNNTFQWRALDGRVSVQISNEGNLEDLKFQIAAACLRRIIPVASCFPAGHLTNATSINKVLHVAPFSDSDDADMERMGKCVYGTKEVPGRVLRIVTGQLGHVSELGSTLGRIYASAVSGACEKDRINTQVDVLLDYLQPKSVVWLAKLLATGYLPVSPDVCQFEAAPREAWSLGGTRSVSVHAAPPLGIDGHLHSCVGGTFDHLHAGHKTLLTMTAVLGLQKVSVGLTSGSMVKKNPDKKCANWIESQEKRREDLQRFLSLIAPGRQHSIVYIDDGWGPTAVDGSISLLVISAEFPLEKLQAAADKMRKAAHPPLPLMHLEQVPLVGITCATPGGHSKFGSSALRVWRHKDDDPPCDPM